MTLNIYETVLSKEGFSSLCPIFQLHGKCIIFLYGTVNFLGKEITKIRPWMKREFLYLLSFCYLVSQIALTSVRNRNTEALIE